MGSCGISCAIGSSEEFSSSPILPGTWSRSHSDLGDDGPPFRWDEERRTLIRAELDAAYFHLYGIERDEVELRHGVLRSLRRREEKPQNFGEFRTKRLILERYDAMAEAIRTGESVPDDP